MHLLEIIGGKFCRNTSKKIYSKYHIRVEKGVHKRGTGVP